jgi:succinate dehydrogenase/fumarate reductase flavoprotein subunit
VDARFETRVRNLFACGEAVGGANGANRLSGNAITEALVFGALAGRHAAERARACGRMPAEAADDFGRARRNGPNPAALIAELQALMSEKAGPFRTGAKLMQALAGLDALADELGDEPLASGGGFDPVLIDWLDLRNMLLVARSVVHPALARTESRGAHQREDCPGLDARWTVNQVVALRDGELRLSRHAPLRGSRGAAA